MFVLRHFAAVAALVLPMSMAEAAAAQPAPISPSITSSTTPLSQSEKAQIGAYAQYWCRQLGEDEADGETIQRARYKLFDPIRAAIRITPIFREAYSEAVIPPLLDVLNNQNPNVRINALQIMGRLGTSDAADELMDLCNIDDEPRMDVRIWASRGLATTMEVGDFPENKISAILRVLEQAAGNELEPLVLRRQFEAIATVGTEAGRMALARAFGQSVRRIQREEREHTRLMPALHRGVTLLLNKYVPLPPAQKTRLGTELGPSLGVVLQIGSRHFESAPGGTATQRDYEAAIGLCETLLKQIDSHVRRTASPNSNLKKHWDERDRAAYDRGVTEWMQVLAGPPYGQ